MKKKNLVSIIMNCHNGERYLKDSISSVIKQSHKNWELVFFDNNSTDNSARIAKSFKNKRIKYFKSKFVNLGIARKKALELCKGEYLTFLDCDDYWHKEKLKTQLNIMQKNLSVGLCFSNSLFFSKNYKRNLYNTRPKDGNIFEDLLKKYFISFDTVFINMKILAKLKQKFDERFTITHDLDLIIRFSMITRFIYIDKVLSFWRIHEKGFSKNKLSIINYEKKLFLNKLKKILKNNKNKKYLINLFEKNLNETHIEEYLINNNKKMFYKKIFKYNIFNLKNFLIFILMIIPGGNKIYINFKKS